ncbi:MAG: PLDc N-terminal domain-containing protein [Planctomycetota bacterium]
MDILLNLTGTLAQSSGPDSPFGLLFLPIFLFALLIGVASLALWVWMLVDCARREFDGPNDKVVWILVIVLVGALGALIYFFVGRPRGRLV